MPLNFSYKTTVAVLISALFLGGCSNLSSLIKKPDERWAGYKTWTKVTEGIEPTGDPTGSLKVVHSGVDGYRDVYVNDIGKAVLLGDGPYVFPIGTVLVKEQFKDKAKWQSDDVADVTVSLKVTDIGEVSVDNWIWSDGYKSKAGPSAFCSGCHTAAAALPQYNSDYVFTTGAFVAKHHRTQ